MLGKGWASPVKDTRTAKCAPQIAFPSVVGVVVKGLPPRTPSVPVELSPDDLLAGQDPQSRRRLRL
jgi:hypothetical protein